MVACSVVNRLIRVASVQGCARSLTALDVRSNDLGDGSAALAGAVSEHQQIKKFCEIPVKQLRDDALTELDLNGKDIGTCGAMVLAHLLKFSRALTSVNLLMNDLGDGAAVVVAAAKQHGNIKTLCGIEEGKTEVDLRHENLEAPDAVLLSFDLESNRALASLDLRRNKIGAGGAKIIAAALPHS